jgi:hypothetical protein
MAVSDVVEIISNMRIIATPISQINQKFVNLRIKWGQRSSEIPSQNGQRRRFSLLIIPFIMDDTLNTKNRL